MYMWGCGSGQYPCPYPFKFVGIIRTRAQTHKSGVLPYPLWVFFAGTHWAWVQLSSLLVKLGIRFKSQSNLRCIDHKL